MPALTAISGEEEGIWAAAGWFALDAGGSSGTTAENSLLYLELSFSLSSPSWWLNYPIYFPIMANTNTGGDPCRKEKYGKINYNLSILTLPNKSRKKPVNRDQNPKSGRGSHYLKKNILRL